MKIAISNIAWRIDEEPRVAELLVKKGIKGVEVAPGKIDPNPTELTADRIKAYRDFWNCRGIAIVAMQALLFGKNDLLLFASSELRREMCKYLSRIIALGGKLGAQTLVFGSPKNRKKGNLSQIGAEKIAIPFFRELGRHAVDAGTRLCIEANPPSYGCDFVTNTREAYEFVKKVDHAGFGLHVDVAAMAQAGEPPDDLVAYGVSINHFHASEPDLRPVIGNDSVNHAGYAQALSSIYYPNWVSIEMREANSPGDTIELVARAIDFVQSVYGG